MTAQIITAEVLDTALTPGVLVIEVEDREIEARITDEMTDTAEALPELIENLHKAGYDFAEDPTDSAGEVELVKIYTSVRQVAIHLVNKYDEMYHTAVYRGGMVGYTIKAGRTLEVTFRELAALTPGEEEVQREFGRYAVEVATIDGEHERLELFHTLQDMAKAVEKILKPAC